LKEEEKKPEPVAEPKVESKGPPRFSGFKGFLSKQNEENAEANKNLAELQKKI